MSVICYCCRAGAATCERHLDRRVWHSQDDDAAHQPRLPRPARIHMRRILHGMQICMNSEVLTMIQLLLLVLQSWFGMLAGRVLYGAGCESLYVTQTTILTYWFQGNGVSLALTALVVSSRLSSVANSIAGPYMPSPQFAFFVGFILSVASWFSALALVNIHDRYVHCSFVLLETCCTCDLGCAMLCVASMDKFQLQVQASPLHRLPGSHFLPRFTM